MPKTEQNIDDINLYAAEEQSHTWHSPDDIPERIARALARKMAEDYFQSDVKAHLDIQAISANDERWEK